MVRQGSRTTCGLLVCVGIVCAWINLSLAIDVKLTAEEAQKALEAGRMPMEKANSPEEVKKVLQHASMVTRVGADPEKDSCGASAILRTKRYRLEVANDMSKAEIIKAQKLAREWLS